MARINFYIVEDNTAPDYVITCTRQGTAIDLSTASTVELIIQRTSDSTITQAAKEATISDASAGEITYTADATDFPSAGTYVADIKITYASGGVEILYNQARFKVRSKIQ